VTIREAATRLGISAAAVRALVRSGVLPHYRPSLGGRRIVLDAADVERHRVASRREGSLAGIGLSRVSLDCPAPFGRRA
jgi:excisionase family DNA binding protein